jgi:hypothetical protein
VQTKTRFGEPLMIARTRWTLGLQRRLVRTCEWLTLLPNEGFFPHVSQTEAMGFLQILSEGLHERSLGLRRARKR